MNSWWLGTARCIQVQGHSACEEVLRVGTWEEARSPTRRTCVDSKKDGYSGDQVRSDEG